MTSTNAPTTRWRRATKFEALRLFFIVFTLAMILHVAWDAVWEDVIDYEGSFFRALWFAPAFALCSLLFKTTLQVEP